MIDEDGAEITFDQVRAYFGLYDTPMSRRSLAYLEALWKVARAAGGLAIIGDCKVIGWNKLNKALHALREREGR